MIQQIMEDKAACNDDVREHLAIIACLKKMLDNAAEKKKKKGPIHGGSNPGRKKSKSRQRLEGHTMLYNGYFSNSATRALGGKDIVVSGPADIQLATSLLPYLVFATILEW
jgi:hypothetical protein